MRCPGCGTETPDTARFCPSCGRPAHADVTISGPEQVTVLAPGGTAIRPPSDVQRPSSSGWLSSSDSISHGRFAPGAILSDRYRIIGLLGRGGMGEVYRADDLRLGQAVALKFLPTELQHDPARLAQFHNEVRIARQVSHPNVCRVYDIGEVSGLLYLSMEYVGGEDLATSLRRIGRFPEDKATDIARQLCAGLAAAHQRGVIHRDLKPANVMLDGEGRVRVMDFGLAVVGGADDVRAGTPAYMAPEQLLGKAVTARSDIFALGLVLYELFTGRRAFTATTIADLQMQHQSRSTEPPSTLVSAMDLSIERAILRCLEPDPERRPSSALAVSAALPGGDPLAAALAAGETPSPEMVAAAGEGIGLRPRVAWPVFGAVLVGILAAFGVALRTSPLDRMRPEYSSEVLAQKARDIVAQLGLSSRGHDRAYEFAWNEDLTKYIHDNDKPSPKWDEILSQSPSPLTFWYRQSPFPLTGFAFHSDLLIPGIVDREDPPPLLSGMTQLELDHRGRLTFFETIPPQRDDAPTRPAPVDWKPVFALAGLDLSKFQTVDPLWNWLAASDTRLAWTGQWPESGRPLRVEAAALGGRPVAFMLVGPWQKPSRMPPPSTARVNATIIVLFALAISILSGAGLLAFRHMRSGRGDRHGAARLGICMSSVLLALWVCQVHLVASLGLLGMLLIAVCTSVFNGVLFWTLYLALEPFVRRHWPQVLVSWSNVLTGRLRDPVVGRDVLFGVALGVAWVLMIRGLDAASGGASLGDFPGSVELLSGLRSTVGAVLQQIPYAIRNMLLYFFLLFVLRVLLRNQWAAALAFVGMFTLLNALSNERPWLGALMGFTYFGTGAIVVLRWGLLSYAVAHFITSIVLSLNATLDTSAWYFGNTLLLAGIALTLAGWGLYTSLGGKLWTTEALN
ncbi:MAG TPA: serine/threonine-protein kinase [Vicinamibacterales bacterium]|nr:serine/threonine-protein kinase [Vicinamibacterales bacterium]